VLAWNDKQKHALKPKKCFTDEMRKKETRIAIVYTMGEFSRVEGLFVLSSLFTVEV